MKLSQVFSRRSVIANLQSEDKDELFEEMLEVARIEQPQLDRAECISALEKRENRMSTGIIHDVAIPHADAKSIHGAVGALGISRTPSGIEYASLDGSPVHFVFLVLFNPDENELHLKVLRELSLLLKDSSFLPGLRDSESPGDIYDFLMERMTRLSSSGAALL